MLLNERYVKFALINRIFGRDCTNIEVPLLLMLSRLFTIAYLTQDTRRRNSCSPLGSTGSSNGSWVPSKEDDSDFRDKNSSEETGKLNFSDTLL